MKRTIMNLLSALRPLSILLLWLSPYHSFAFLSPSSFAIHHPKIHSSAPDDPRHSNRVVPPLHQSSTDDTERRRGKVRTLLVNSVNKAASLSKSVLNKGGAPIANVLLEAAHDAKNVVAGVVDRDEIPLDRLLRILNGIEKSLDRMEEEMRALRGELRGVRAMLTSSFDADAAVAGDLTHVQSEQPSLELNDDEFSNESSLQEQDTTQEIDLSSLRYEDIDYTLTDMAPPFINDDECLIPGEPLVRVEKAPQNSRRIFAGIDIPVSVQEVWNLLTDYENLQNVVPNLVVNEVLEILPGSTNDTQPVLSTQSRILSDAEQCREIANKMKGAVLKQVGGAKVVGINFSAKTTLEVREWPHGMPDFAHFEEEVYEGKSRSDRVKESRKRELTRYVFPRPFALSSLPHKDISMQNIENDDGEFRMYQVREKVIFCTLFLLLFY
ncbi:hypothetical protein ACHAWX_004022 [Stephanocyclus meneghinianus]